MAKPKPTRIRTYVEGGSIGRSNNSSDVDALKQSFHRFFKLFMAQPPEVTPKVSGGKTLSTFSGAGQHSKVEIPLLLIDSEGQAPHPDEIHFKQFLTQKGQRSKNKRLLANISEDQTATIRQREH